MKKFVLQFAACALLCVSAQSTFAQGSKVRPAFDVLHYDFELHLKKNLDNIVGEAGVRIVVSEEVKVFDLDLTAEKDDKGMTVSQVFVNGKPARYTHEGELLTITPKKKLNAGDTAYVQISYDGIPADGLIISKNKFGEKTFFGDNWPNRAHHWLPVVDHPADKATVSWKVHSPAPYQVVANGKLITEEKKDGTYFYHYQCDVPLPTKVMVIGAAAFSTKVYREVEGVPVSAWVFPDNAGSGFKDYAPAPEVLGWFIENVGEYLYGKLANVQSKTRYGGMENASNIFYFEGSVNGRGEVEDLIAHEIAHQWFGNTATEADWSHIWLSEGFATYFENLYMGEAHGEELFRKRLQSDRERIIIFARNNDHAVIDTVYKNINQLLNTNSYQKGGWFLHMLRQKIGDEAFWATIRKYYDTYKYSNAWTSDFRRIAEQESGMKLKPFFDQWLRRGGHPEVVAYWKKVDANRLEITLRQTQEGGLFTFPIEVEVTDENGEKIRETVQVTEKEHQFRMTVTGKVKGLALDPDTKLLFEGKVRGN